MAVAESMIIYFCMLTLFANTAITKDNTLFSMGDLSFVAVVIVISVKLQILEMHNKSFVAGPSVFLSPAPSFSGILCLLQSIRRRQLIKHLEAFSPVSNKTQHGG